VPHCTLCFRGKMNLAHSFRPVWLYLVFIKTGF
jgi:hypothetical protein